MRHVLIPAILLAALAQAAAASDPAAFEWNKEKFDLVASGDPEAGKALAKEHKCKRCHNETGVSDDPDVPSIAGQRATYMYKQLSDFRNELRDDRDMQKVAKKLSDQEMVDLSAWFAAQERPAMVGGEAMLVVKICDSCHDKDIVEEDDHIEVAPILIGQIREYLEKTMLAFKQADRSNDLFHRMQSVSHKLTDQEIKALAKYYGAPDSE